MPPLIACHHRDAFGVFGHQGRAEPARIAEVGKPHGAQTVKGAPAALGLLDHALSLPSGNRRSAPEIRVHSLARDLGAFKGAKLRQAGAGWDGVCSILDARRQGRTRAFGTTAGAVRGSKAAGGRRFGAQGNLQATLSTLARFVAAGSSAVTETGCTSQSGSHHPESGDPRVSWPRPTPVATSPRLQQASLHQAHLEPRRSVQSRDLLPMRPQPFGHLWRRRFFQRQVQRTRAQEQAGRPDARLRPRRRPPR